MKLLNVLLTEISEKVKNKLLAKFAGQTQDSVETIGTYIDEFEKFQNGLPVDRRDLNRYSYDELKSLIDSKRSAKSFTEIYNMFKKKGKEAKAAGGVDIPNTELKRAIKKFLEIKSALPGTKQDITKYEWLELVEVLERNYLKLLTKKLKEKYRKTNPTLTDTQILYYISEYVDNFNQIPIEHKNADEMSFQEMEHLLDGLQSGKEVQKTKQDTSDIPMVYDENNLKIFAPTVKDQCIKLGNGRTWCTSREGGSNLYYNYRLGHERTLYYVIDEDLPFKDLNFACVILVDPYGSMSLADGSNSGRYSGHQNIPWSEIESKLPKLQGLKELFVPKPLTQEEKDLIKKVDNAHPGENPTEYFNNDEATVEMWLEYNSPSLNDSQYSNISDNLKKKYIALGQDLTAGQLSDSPPDVVKYYVSKKMESLKTVSLNRLSGGDIALLNSPLLKKLKEELKPKFASELSTSNNSKTIELTFPGRNEGNFLSLYGFEDIIPSLPKEMTKLTIKSKEAGLFIAIPDSITQFQNLQTVTFENCLKELNSAICKLPRLQFLNIPKNNELKTIPDCIIQIPSLVLLNTLDCENLVHPKGIENYASPLQWEGGESSGNGKIWDFQMMNDDED